MKFISSKAHTVIGLIVGVLLLLAPSIFNFTDNGAATATAIVIGLFIILNEIITTSPYSPLKLVPMKVHIVIDVLTGLVLALSPWLFGFMDSSSANQWVPHLIVGILTVGYALMTSTADERVSDVAKA